MKVLLVDDNKDLTMLLSEFLKGNGIDSKVINDPKIGLFNIKKENYDVIFLDNHMPGFTGINIIQTLEREKILKNQKIILFSGADFSSAEINDLLKKDGVHACLKKPIHLHNLLASITC